MTEGWAWARGRRAWVHSRRVGHLQTGAVVPAVRTLYFKATRICLIIASCSYATGAAEAVLARPPRVPTYLDPATYCAAIRSTRDVVSREIGHRYRGPDTPRWMSRALGAAPATIGTQPIYWRCRNGRVLACQAGMSGLNAQVCFRDTVVSGWDESAWADVTPRR